MFSTLLRVLAATAAALILISIALVVFVDHGGTGLLVLTLIPVVGLLMFFSPRSRVRPDLDPVGVDEAPMRQDLRMTERQVSEALLAYAHRCGWLSAGDYVVRWGYDPAVDFETQSIRVRFDPSGSASFHGPG